FDNRAVALRPLTRPPVNPRAPIMLRVHLSNTRDHREFEHSAGPLELARGLQRNAVPRCTIQNLYAPKDHALFRELEDGQVRLENLSQRNAIRLGDGVLIPVGAGRNLDPPLSFTIGETTVRIDAVAETELDGPLETCATPRCRSRLDEGQS